MLAELHGKAGNLCTKAEAGVLRCPLLVRSTSKDVVTAEFVRTLRIINPQWWLPGLLNAGLGHRRYDTQVYRSLRIEPWVNYPPFPRELLPYDEGSTQVDLVLSWDNPPTTVFIEAKYGSVLSNQTANSVSSKDQPADQLIRNIRVGVHSCGYFEDADLFGLEPRDFFALVFAPLKGSRLVERYRNQKSLLKAIPCSGRLVRLPKPPFLAEIDYRDVRQVLQAERRFMTPAERQATDQLSDYLSFKLQTRPNRQLSGSSDLRVLE